MAYVANTPNGANLISSTQPIILGNFQQLPVDFGADHYTFGQTYPLAAPYNVAGTGDDGKHKQLTLVRASADVTNGGANELALYNKTATAPAAQEIFFRRETSGTVIQMTAGTPVSAVKGATFLPGGLLMKWGEAAVLSQAGVQGPVAFDATNAFSAAPYSISLTLVATSPGTDMRFSVSGAPNAMTATGFHLFSNNAGTIKYVAIGPA